MITIRNLIIGTTIGVIIALFLGLVSDWELAIKVTGGIGVISLLLAGVLSGFFMIGDRTRAANHSFETTADRELRSKYSSVLFLFGLPFIITAILINLITQ
ncbi:DUF5316 family protein [Paenibacillus macquariensis]|uniref:DUF5316 domain-containing protein n=1 Tax=Paenibacillus macquariensis TaxID=948756 RepID=A0ABY1JPF6_9BACL|nr:DUF5316 family protein [Paenibacillus macquariensis]MEC0091975.1 DUF5316 family protein [Paenibacillus macquariensis]OAB37451.1 hypothetical protein PMSM_05155 [Paenibacillus macquariensis subsp. macquariensis]SIQ53560.1 hypothetical protein SAMN05421578_102461 [Paenibacillus macquariensis]